MKLLLFNSRLGFSIVLFTFLSLPILFLSSSCTNKQPSNHNAALPHTDALPNKGLTASERSKLTNALGKTAEEVSIEDIEQMFDAAADRLHIFSFWKLDCIDCIQQLEILSASCAELDPSSYRLVLINLDNKSKLAAVNTLIREKNIHAQTYMLRSENEPKWQDGINKNWKGELPVIFFENEKDGTKLMFNKKLEQNELSSIIQSLLI